MPLDPPDHVAIQQLYAAYNFAADEGDASGFADCFVPDGALDLGASRLEGHGALKEFVTGIGGGRRHIVANVHVEGDGDRARGRAYLMLVSTSSPFAITSTGQYEDDLVRVSDGWRFAARRYTPDKAPS